jgi:hypothetical protein
MLAKTDPQPDFRLGQNDDKVPWNQTITDAFGNAIDIFGATSVKLRFGPKNQTLPAADKTGAVIGSSPMTQAQYLFLAADTATPGNYSAEFHITLAGGERITWPVGRLATVEIVAQSA